MSNNTNNTMMFWKKNFPLCSFSISKCLPTTTTATGSPPHPSTTTSSSSDDFRYFQTTNFSSSYSSSYTTTTNFNSLYTNTNTNNNESSSSSSSAEPDFSAAFNSRRFFFAAPGKSNSIVDQYAKDDKRHVVLRRSRRTASFDGAAVEVRKYSADPRVDFRRSMQEMIEARKNSNSNSNSDSTTTNNDDDERSDLEYLHELLLCFLALNPKDTHKYVISAFTDIVVDLLSSPPETHRRRHREVKLRRKRNGLRRMSM